MSSSSSCSNGLQGAVQAEPHDPCFKRTLMLWGARAEMTSRHVAVFKFKAEGSSLPYLAKDSVEPDTREHARLLVL